MLTLTSNEQAKSLIKNGVLHINGDIEIAFNGFNIDAYLKCKNIYSKDFNRNIKCGNIKCGNIYCGNIDARHINYYAFCIAYENINCNSISGRRENSFHKCLNGKLTIKDHTKTLDGKTYTFTENNGIITLTPLTNV